MTLRHMRIFSAVYRCGSITKAAEALYLTQPSVSVAIQELEAHYGVRLFERTGRRIVPTESGRTFYALLIYRHCVLLQKKAGVCSPARLYFFFQRKPYRSSGKKLVPFCGAGAWK